MKDNPEKKFWSRVFGGGGFYIALLLCIVAVGIGVWALTGGIGSNSTKVTAQVPASVADSDSEDAFNPKTPVPTVTVMPEETAEPKTTPAASPAASPKAETTPKPDMAPAVYVWPLAGEITLEYSVDALIYNPVQEDWRTHAGIDISAEEGAEVAAVSSGTVESIESGGAMGVTVTLYHGVGIRSTYSNLAEALAVAVGDSVEIGDTIGYVGTTAITEGAIAHLHLAMSVDNLPVDPLVYLP